MCAPPGDSAGEKLMLPTVVFDPDTIVIVFNGDNHFDCTSFVRPPLGQTIEAWLPELERMARVEHQVVDVSLC